MTTPTQIKLIAVTDREGLLIRHTVERLHALRTATGADIGVEADLLHKLVRRIDRAPVVLDYYDKYGTEE